LDDASDAVLQEERDVNKLDAGGTTLCIKGCPPIDGEDVTDDSDDDDVDEIPTDISINVFNTNLRNGRLKRLLESDVDDVVDVCVVVAAAAAAAVVVAAAAVGDKNDFEWTDDDDEEETGDESFPADDDVCENGEENADD
jgi:ribosomal protein L12E/L44/L45/RPP1/RPP2